MKERNTKGITLIALIITVIILLILAGTAISISINGGDLFSKATTAREEWNSAVAQENAVINGYLGHLDQYSSNSGNSGYNADAEHPWGDLATEEQVIQNIFNYEILTPAAGQVEDVEGVYELGKVADTSDNIKLADNNTMGAVKITGLNYDAMFQDVPGYVVGTIAGSELDGDLTNVLKTYTQNLIVPATVKLNSSGQYDTTGTEYKIEEIGGFSFDEGDSAYNHLLDKTKLNIVLPYGIKRISENAFRYNTGITSVAIPNSLTSIGDDAFWFCSGLTSITFPNSVTSIGDRAFAFCTGLTSLTIPGSVTSIGDRVFAGCTGLTSLTIQNGVTSIGWTAFDECTGLTSVKLPNSVTYLGANAFVYCENLENVTLSNNLTTIDVGAFVCCYKLTSITIPKSVTEIKESAFPERFNNH